MSASALRSRAIIHLVLGSLALGIAYVLSARAFGTVDSEFGRHVCGPAVFGRLDPVPTPECVAHLEHFTIFSGIAVLIGAFLIVSAVRARFQAGRAYALYRY